MFSFDGVPRFCDDAGAFKREEEGEDDCENDIGDDTSDSSDANNGDVADVGDEIAREGLERGDDFSLEVFDADALAEIVDAVPAAESVFKNFGKLLDELGGLFDDDWPNNGDDNA